MPQRARRACRGGGETEAAPGVVVLRAWHCLGAPSRPNPPASLLLCPGQGFSRLLRMSSAWHKRFLFGLAPYQGPASGSFSGELRQVGPGSEGEGREKTRDQLHRGEPAGR